MIGPVRAVRNGAARLARARRVVVWLWLANLLFALPLAVAVGASIGNSIGASQVAERLLEGLDLIWHSEYAAVTDGVGGTLQPSQVGVGAFLDNLELWFSGALFELEPGLVAAGVLYALVWALLLGGVLAYLQSGDVPTVRGFFGFGGEFFFRFVRLTAVVGVLYYGVFRFSRWLFARLEHLTRDVTAEKSVLLVYLGAAALVLLLLVFLRMISDYAKIAMVIEDRRSALLAALRGARFVAGKPLRTFGLVLLIAGVGAVALYLYSQVAPGVGQATWLAVIGAFLVSQLFLIVRLGLRLTLLGAELDLYERTSPFAGLAEGD